MEDKQVLSQDEVNALLSAVDEGDLDLKPTDGSTPDEETVPSKPYRKHDFTTPGRISRDHYRVMSLLHKLFARTLSSPLSSLLRSLVEVECETIDQLTFGDFVMSLSDPSCLCKLAMNPLPGTVIMEISPELVFPVIEKLLGGQGEQGPRRRMTDIEKVIMKQMIDLVTQNLGSVWKKTKEDIEFVLEEIEREPDYVQVVAPTETVMIVVLSVKFGRISGLISICFPVVTIERALAEVSFDELQSSTSTSGIDRDEEYQPKIQQRLDHTQMVLRAVLPTSRLTVRELMQLEVGRILELDVRVETIGNQTQILDPIIIEVGEKPRFLARLGKFGKHQAVKIIGLTEDEDA